MQNRQPVTRSNTHFLSRPTPWALNLAIERISALENWVDVVLPELDRLSKLLDGERDRAMELVWFYAAGLFFSLGALVGFELWKLF